MLCVEEVDVSVLYDVVVEVLVLRVDVDDAVLLDVDEVELNVAVDVGGFATGTSKAATLMLTFALLVPFANAFCNF